MAGTETQAPQSATASKPALPKGQTAGGTAQADSQLIYRDWAAI